MIIGWLAAQVNEFEESAKGFLHLKTLMEGGKEMDSKKTECQMSDPAFCPETNRSGEPEDALLDPSKMTPEEMRDYLNELLRGRSLDD